MVYTTIQKFRSLYAKENQDAEKKKLEAKPAIIDFEKKGDE
jgi:hypothetical protein